MKKTLFGLLLILVSTITSAQMRKGDYYYELYRYHEAIDAYQKPAKSKNIKERQNAVTKIANCYRFLRENENAYIWYSKAVRFKKYDNIMLYYLAEATRGVGKYDEAESLFRRYSMLSKNKNNSTLLGKYCLEIKKWDILEEDYVVENFKSLNTVYSEYSPVKYGEGLLFASDRANRIVKDPILRMYRIKDMKSPKVKSFDRKLTSKISHDGPASVCQDGKQIYFTRVFSGGLRDNNKKIVTSLLKIYSSDLKDGNWSNPVAFKHNKDSASVGHPSLSHDGNTIYFSSNMKGGVGESDLYVSTKSNGKWGKPMNLGDKINTNGKELFPYIHNDTVLYFSSNMHCGYGGLDIFKSVKRYGEWQEPVNLRKPVNSPYDDFGVLFLDDDRNGFISSNRKGSKGGDDIYRIRENVSSKHVLVKGVVKSDIHGFIKDAKVFLLNEKLEEVDIVKTDILGRFSFDVQRGVKYNMKISADYHYSKDHDYFITSKVKVDNPHFKETPFVLKRMDLKIARYADTVFFGLNKHNLRLRSKMTLKGVKKFLNKNKDVRLLISSFTDMRGSVDYNKKLSEKRARSVYAYLLKIGSIADRVEIRAMGKFGNEDRGDSADENYHQFCRRADLFLEYDKPELHDKYDFGKYSYKKRYTIKDFEKTFFKH